MEASHDELEVHRFLIVDDHPHGREGMRDIVESEPAFVVVGEASSGEEAIEAVERLKPHIVLMDVNMPGMGGLEATQRIKQQHPSVMIVIVTVEDDITFLFEALKRGAQGYLLKNQHPSAWHSYLRAIAYEETPMDKDLAHQLIREFAGQSGIGTGSRGISAGVPKLRDVRAGRTNGVIGVSTGEASLEEGKEVCVTPLTHREREVLERVARGESNREVAAGLGLSEHTVKNHMKNIMQKLHLDNRVQLSRFAYENGLA